MELGYNTDITIDSGTYHVQTEGRLDQNPRVETLVYKSGVVLSRLSNPDTELGKEDHRIEETKRKIRDQHLSVVALVRRTEFEKIASVQPSRTAYDFLDLVPMGEWHDLLMGRHEAVFEEFKRGLADAAALVTPMARSKEFRAILGAFATFLADESVPINRKQGLCWYLLRLDQRFRAIDFYEAFRRERGDVKEYSALAAALKRATDRLVDLLIRQSSGESALATELLLDLFTRQSMEIVKYLFEEAEKKLSGDRRDEHDVLPTVLLYLEEKVTSEVLPTKELDDIFDRLNYLYARLSVKVVRDVSGRIAKMRDERGVRIRLRPEQKKMVVEYIDFLEECKAGIEKERELEKKLALISEYKTSIDGWDKVLRLYMNLRLALKGYHNFVTVNILETAEVVCMRLTKILPGLSSEARAAAEPVLEELQSSLKANMNVRKIIVPAIKAQAIVAGQAARAASVPVAPPSEPAPKGGGVEATAEKAMAANPVATPSSEAAAPALSVRQVEERIKVWALALLKAMDELGRALAELSEMERRTDLDEPQRARLLACRRELQSKKKVLQQRLSSL